MEGPTNGFKGIVGLIALAYLGYLLCKVGVMVYSRGGLDAESAFSYGVGILAFGGLVYASFALNAYRFSGTPLYYLATAVLMAQIGWYGYIKAVGISNDMSMLAVSLPVGVPPKPVPVSSPRPAPSPVAVVPATPPPQPVADSAWAKDGPSGPVLITPDSKYLNGDHVRTVLQPTPAANMAASDDTTNSATSTR